MASKLARWPEHEARRELVKRPFEPPNAVDPYAWMNAMTKEELDEFLEKEHTFAQMKLFKDDVLEKTILREEEFYTQSQQMIPLKIGEHMYYRRFTNMADALTLYRCPLEDMDDLEPSVEAEEMVFSLADLVALYDNYALEDARIKTFIEKIKDLVATSEHQPMHWFRLSPDHGFAAIVLDTE